jgi:GNAT superfamily N-acetyltransferase
VVNVTIRRATPSDLEHIIPLCIDYCATHNREVNEPMIRSGLAGLLDSDANGFILIACDEHDSLIRDEHDSLIRYESVSSGWSLGVGGAAYILHEIFVQQRGEGIGQQLITAAEDRYSDLGVRRIFLETERPNDRARSLHARLGFVEDDSVRMSKDL